MITNRLFRYNILFALLSLAPLCSMASTWQAIRATYDYSPHVLGSQLNFSNFGGFYFSDGQYGPFDKPLLTTNNSATFVSPLVTGYVDTIAFSSANINATILPPPQVDLANMRADFSSLGLTEWVENNDGSGLQAEFGWDVGSPGWIPIIANGDGTYTASWLTIQPFPDFIPQSQFNLTFAPAPVPVPAAAWLFGSVLVLFFKLQRTARPVPSTF
jgi:hypothetical protein